ncbi:MAG TPA: archaemetzincin [Sedimentisphaerales bacterium]|nr:archaemetzincin [Sedimentisphaerales bacterium]
MDFRPPPAKERLRAIGSTEGLPKTLSKALDPGPAFEPVPAPKAGDWLAVHLEPGQTFDAFVKSRPNRPDKTRSTIYLQPLGEFPQTQAPPVDALNQYAAAYFAMQVKVLPALTLKDSNITTRVNTFTRKRQILTDDVLAILERNLPADAFCLLAITMDDLYPDPSWNFVFGQASLRERVGVYSFARYDPAFYGEKRDKDYQKLLLRRCAKVLVHETGHMFGLHHCIYFRCVLNGSNHLQESDSRPMHLCPVCLRKLQYGTGFDVVSRYANLCRFYKNVGFDKDAQWVANRLEWILGVEPARAIVEQEDSH